MHCTPDGDREVAAAPCRWPDTSAALPCPHLKFSPLSKSCEQVQFAAAHWKIIGLYPILGGAVCLASQTTHGKGQKVVTPIQKDVNPLSMETTIRWWGKRDVQIQFTFFTDSYTPGRNSEHWTKVLMQVYGGWEGALNLSSHAEAKQEAPPSTG